MSKIKAIKPKKAIKKPARKKSTILESPDFQSLFESVPDLYLILLPDKNFTITAVSDVYAATTLTKRDEIVGKGLFEVFPDNPNDLDADGVSNLRASLNRVIKLKKADAMAPQKYDIRKPESEGGGWEARYWDPLNSPLLDKNGNVKYIIHRVKDITEMIRLAERESEQLKYTKALEASERENIQKLKLSEERFRHLTQSIKDYAIFMIDVNGIIISWNKGAERIKGYQANEIIGKPTSIFYLEKDRNEGKPKEHLELALKNGRHEVEGWRMRKDRSIFWADVVYTSIYDDAGNHTGFSEITRDLTFQKRAEEEIMRSNDFLNSVLENIPNMVFVKDAKYLRFVRFNKAGEQLIGTSRKHLIGKNDYDFFPKEQADHFTAKDRLVLEMGSLVDIPEELIDTQNGQRWLHTRKIPINDANGTPLYLLGVSEDITERRIVDEQIRQLNRELSQSIMQHELANKELESFSYSVSHDLRAPLRAIRGYTKILMEDYAASLEADAQNMMNAVTENAERMSQLIDDLLAFSRMGKKEMNICDVNMKIIAHEAVNGIKAANGNSIKAKITIHELLPTKADSSLMGNVFTNLISNAIKYSSKSSAPEVEVNSFHKDGENIYYVKDNGVGFDMKYYDKLYGVFQRLHSNAEFEGTGVGLALVKRIITRHGGRVWAEAEPDKGATFYIALHTSNNNS
ncbi:MAG TPA: PAS domain S-box protein [Bacteroidia bacterium]|jgi:PAS domain S-box-containing protein|nr:PAS domain S-box protein [Bacteroidia bacterium]